MTKYKITISDVLGNNEVLYFTCNRKSFAVEKALSKIRDDVKNFGDNQQTYKIVKA